MGQLSLCKSNTLKKNKKSYFCSLTASAFLSVNTPPIKMYFFCILFCVQTETKSLKTRALIYK